MPCSTLEAQLEPQVADLPQSQREASVSPDVDVYGATLVYFMHRLLDFREAELHALASMSGISREVLNQRKLPDDHDLSPLRVIAAVPRHQQEQICSRAVLVKGMFEIWGHGCTVAELKESLRQCPQHIKAPWLDKSVSFRFVVDGFGSKVPDEDKLALMDVVTDVCPFEGDIDLKQADVKLWIIIVDTRNNQGLPPEIPYRLVAAREVVVGKTRSLANSYALPKRRYLGPTSMDHELSFVMCNLGHVQKGSLVYDPFAGTGSILVSAAAWGAHVLGTDIDIRVIRDGKRDKQGNHCNVYTNFKDYGLQDPVGLIRADTAHPPWRPGVEAVADVILCDPPYGVRAGGRKVAAKSHSGEPLHSRAGYIPSTTAYGLVECLVDLLETSARLLVLGGRLCFWLPDFTEEAHTAAITHGSFTTSEAGSDALAQEHAVPQVGSVHRDPHLASNGETVLQHPCMHVWNNSVQTLSTRYMRRLVTMVKVKPFDEQESAAWRKSLEGMQLPIDKLHDVVYEARQAPPSKQGKKARYRGKCQ